MISAHREGRLLRSLLIACLLCGMYPLLVQAEIWSRTPINGMRDVTVALNGIVWLTDKNGAVWKSDNIYASSLTQMETSGFSRIAVGPDGVVWAVKSNGTLWKFATDSWSETAAKEIEDVAVAPDSKKVWVVGKDGTVWLSSDQGQRFIQIEGSDFSRISVKSESMVWAVKSDGTVWKLASGGWSETAANEIEDIAIAPNGLIWLTGKDGTVSSSSDDGVTFSQYEEVGGLKNIAARNRDAWAVSFDGTLWHKFFSPQF
ncbi:tectonin domain-containing protein [Nitrosomonas sp. Nm34]|uniref:tectonin domain-containing protein n=1 Tax=Nitrosomonas sp. Nm34 TaxID=1881055 RepID=UPI0008F3912A|nr:tectonin domain-containing protein [Nitrosomonas sp. Nm34]SFI42229.1 hypothetical protein SAMN05428978_100965 [Nitrosomonas sp. Nm34]